jgi:hypothetical protein
MAPSSTLPYPSPRNADERHANFIASSRPIVGASWDLRPRSWWIPTGLEWANDPKNPLPAYLPPFFGAQKEWANDDQGWTHVSHHRKKKNYRRRQEVVMEDNYSVNEE